MPVMKAHEAGCERGRKAAKHMETANFLLLPRFNVAKLMATMLPPHARTSEQVKTAMQDYASEFIGFIMSEAAARAITVKGRKYISDDILRDSMLCLGAQHACLTLACFTKRLFWARPLNRPHLGLTRAASSACTRFG